MTLPGSETPGDGRPRVAGNPANRGVWFFAAALLALAVGLFIALETRRDAQGGSQVQPDIVNAGGTITAPPELVLPAMPDGRDAAAAPMQGLLLPTPPGQQAGAVMLSGRRAGSHIPMPPTSYPAPPTYMGPPRTVSPRYPQAADPGPQGPAAPAASEVDGRAVASRLANPSYTVPQGSMISAVLETAFDSTQPGYARAIVSRDVRSFDGSRVLIPRGSKLFGEYAASLSLGQKRALVQWRRLTRPDGVIIDIDSPSTDQLGRTGIKGKVNSHFLQRFGGAILQSVLDAGVQVATRATTNDTVVVALPNSTQTIGDQRAEQIRPTLKVRQGTTVAVLVARDLDFTAVEP